MRPIPDTVILERTPDGLAVRMIDQTLLPTCEQIIDVTTVPDLCEAIRMLRVRGAPAIGCAAACGVAMAASRSEAGTLPALQAELRQVIADLAATRPTAVNLFWAVDRMKRVLEVSHSCADMKKNLESEAIRIFEEDWEVNRRIGENGKALIHDGDGVLTHCNAGALATAGFGTALGVIYAAWAEGPAEEAQPDDGAVVQKPLNTDKFVADSVVRRGSAVAPFVYLTIDDCLVPSAVERALDIAAEKGVKLTFFPIGSVLQQAPELWRRG